MDLNDVADQLAERLDTINGLRVHAYPPPTVTPPAIVVGYPEQVDFDETYGRGMDRIPRWPIVAVVGKASERAARKKILGYASGSGPDSVKAVLESGTYAAFDTLRVVSVEFDVITIAGTDYISALFFVDIAGDGA